MIEPPTWISRESWDAFREMRRKIKAPLANDYAEKRVIASLCRLKSAGQDPQACLDQSIELSWRGVFALRENPVASNAPRNDDFTRYDEERKLPAADPEKRKAAIRLAQASVKRVA
jgi:hypothetical protein